MRLTWDNAGERLFETGVDRGVLYPYKNGAYEKGVVWNGLTAVNENPSGAEPTALYADGIKYVTLMSVEELGLGIEAYMYPDEFSECDGSVELKPGVYIGQQDRKMFGISYRTFIGNDKEGTSHGYKIHLVYGCLASATDKEHSTVNDSPDVNPMSWDVSTTPVEIEGYKPSSSIVINSTEIDASQLKTIEDKLYGTADTEPELLLPDEIVALISG